MSTAIESPPGARGPSLKSVGGVLPLLRRHTIIALILLLFVFIIGIESIRPGTVSPQLDLERLAVRGAAWAYSLRARRWSC